MASKDNDDGKPEGEEAEVSLDLSQAAVKRMIADAKERGYITYDQLNSVMPPEQVSSEQIEDVMSMLSWAGPTSPAPLPLVWLLRMCRRLMRSLSLSSSPVALKPSLMPRPLLVTSSLASSSVSNSQAFLKACVKGPALTLVAADSIDLSSCFM